MSLGCSFQLVEGASHLGGELQGCVTLFFERIHSGLGWTAFIRSGGGLLVLLGTGKTVREVLGLGDKGCEKGLQGRVWGLA